MNSRYLIAAISLSQNIEILPGIIIFFIGTIKTDIEC